MASIAHGGSELDSGVPARSDAAVASTRGSPPVSEAALAIADELLGQREPEAAGLSEEEATPPGSAGTRLLVGGQTLTVPAQGVVLGRQPGPAGIVVADGSVSRRHARIHLNGTGIAVVDLGSTNGTLVVRGESLARAGPEGTPATAGDRIVTANGVLLAEVVGESPSGKL